jgi:hypothetical protein
MKINVLAKRVDGHDDAGLALRQVERGAQVFEETLVRQAAQILKQV